MNSAPTLPASVRTRRATSSWSVVAGQEVRDLWVGGRALILLLVFTLLASAMTYILATDKELSLLGQKDMVKIIGQLAISVGAILGILAGADAFSGERERSTLESLLVTPASRRGIVVGKLLAALSMWGGALLLIIPYLWIVSTGTGLFPQALLLTVLLGSCIVLAFTGLALTVSATVKTNRTSLATSLLVYFVLMAPTQTPSLTRKGWLGDVVSQVNPMTAAAHAIDKILASNHTWSQESGYMVSPVVAALLSLALVMFVAVRKVRLGGGA